MSGKTLCVIHEAIGEQGAIARVAMGGVRIALDAGWRVSVVANFLDPSLATHVEWLKLYVPPRGFALKWLTAGTFIRRAMGSRAFDVIHAHQPQAASIADVFQCHYLTRAAQERGYEIENRSLRSRLSRAQERLVLRAEDRSYRDRNPTAWMLFNSEMTRGDFHRFYGRPSREQTLVLPCPAAVAPDAERRQLAREKWVGVDVNQIVIGFLGGTQPRKGFQRLLDAVAADENLLLLMGGPGSEGFGDARLRSRCRSVGYVKEPGDFYAACDVFAVPSRYEPLGLVALEAAAYGVPVIATEEVGALQYLLQHGAGARWGGREPIAPLIHEILDRRAQYAAGCAALASDLSESRYAAKLLSCYESVVAAARRLRANLMPLRIMFLYNADWSKEIRDVASGKVPSHRLFGLSELKLLGYDAFACPTPRSIAKALKRPAIWRIYQAMFARFREPRIDCLVATHESAALLALLLKKMRLLRTPIVVMSVALLHPRNLCGIRKKLWQWVLPVAEAVICYASAQKEWLVAAYALPQDRVEFVPFGVDVDFFPATESAPERGFSEAISVGTNDGKDFPTLLAALPDNANLTVVTDDFNADQIARTDSPALKQGRVRVFKAVPIDRLRSLYEEATVHVIPLLETRFSSGQTVLLENMAMGRLVIVTDCSATRDYVVNDVTALTVRPGDVGQLRRRMEAVFQDPLRFRCVGESATAKVRECFSARRTACKLADLIERVAGS